MTRADARSCAPQNVRLVGSLSPAGLGKPLRFRLTGGHEFINDNLVKAAAARLGILIGDQMAEGAEAASIAKLAQACGKAETPAVSEIRKMDAYA